jgi:predicted SAM-dependent methyltransferase
LRQQSNKTIGTPALLNLGCGNRFKDGWVNIDFNSQDPSIINHDLTTSLPFETGCFDLVYHSHVLEHLNPIQGQNLIHECYRVLKPGGIIRVIVPDLEDIARSYLEALDEVKNKGGEFQDLYWMHLELYDQLVREQPDGGFKAFFSQKNICNQDFVINRMGDWARQVIEYHSSLSVNFRSSFNRQKQPFLVNLKLSLKRVIRFLAQFSNPRSILIKLILGNQYHFYQIGRFRMSGEVHKCMYDFCTLDHLLQQSGFTQVMQVDAYSSQSSFWNPQGLDTEENLGVYHAHSLFVEACKPL